MNAWLLAASAASAATALVHVFVGGRFIARPLLASAELSNVPKYTTYYCWHLVSLMLVAMAAAFAFAALRPAEISLAAFATLLAAAFAIWSIALIVSRRQSPRLMPQWALFVSIATLGALGLGAPS